MSNYSRKNIFVDKLVYRAGMIRKTSFSFFDENVHVLGCCVKKEFVSRECWSVWKMFHNIVVTKQLKENWKLRNFHFGREICFGIPNNKKKRFELIFHEQKVGEIFVNYRASDPAAVVSAKRCFLSFQMYTLLSVIFTRLQFQLFFSERPKSHKNLYQHSVNGG